MNMYGDAYRRRRTHRKHDYRFVPYQEETREERLNRWCEYFLMMATMVVMMSAFVGLGYCWFMGWL